MCIWLWRDPQRHCCRFSRTQFEEADALSRKKDSIKGFFPPEQRIEGSEQPQVVSLTTGVEWRGRWAQ